MLVIAIHNDGVGASARSPAHAELLARLARGREELSPAVYAKSARREAAAQALRLAKLEAIAAKAAKAGDRAEEGAGRRLRIAAAAKTRVLAKVDDANSRAEERSAAASARCKTERSRRTARERLVREARAARDAERSQRARALSAKAAHAIAKRQKTIQATVDHAHGRGMHALAVADAARREREVGPVCVALHVTPHSEENRFWCETYSKEIFIFFKFPL